MKPICDINGEPGLPVGPADTVMQATFLLNQCSPKARRSNRYFKDRNIVWCIYLCVFSQVIAKGDLPLN